MTGAYEGFILSDFRTGVGAQSFYTFHPITGAMGVATGPVFPPSRPFPYGYNVEPPVVT